LGGDAAFRLVGVGRDRCTGGFHRGVGLCDAAFGFGCRRRNGGLHRGRGRWYAIDLNAAAAAMAKPNNSTKRDKGDCTKGRKDRYVMLPPKLLAMLREYPGLGLV
jgi:hypothetical protein